MRTITSLILLQKLDHCGLRGVTNNWFASYLLGRQQITQIGIKNISKKEVILSGVPQEAWSWPVPPSSTGPLCHEDPPLSCTYHAIVPNCPLTQATYPSLLPFLSWKIYHNQHQWVESYQYDSREVDNHLHSAHVCMHHEIAFPAGMLHCLQKSLSNVTYATIPALDEAVLMSKVLLVINLDSLKISLRSCLWFVFMKKSIVTCKFSYSVTYLFPPG